MWEPFKQKHGAGMKFNLFCNFYLKAENRQYVVTLVFGYASVTKPYLFLLFGLDLGYGVWEKWEAREKGTGASRKVNTWLVELTENCVFNFGCPVNGLLWE